MFTSGFQESLASEATITGKPEAFQILLDYLCSGKLHVPSNATCTAVMDVLKMAHYLQYNFVVNRCEHLLLQNFQQCTMKDVLQMMPESDVFGLGRLKTRCKQYLAENFDGSEEFLQCMTSESIVETLNDKDFNAMDEKKVFDIIVAWLKHDWEARKAFAPLLFQSIRLGAVPAGYITVTFLESPELNSIPECRQMVDRVMQLLDSKKPDDTALRVSHPSLFETRSTITTMVDVYNWSFFDITEKQHGHRTKSWKPLEQFLPIMPDGNCRQCINLFDSCVDANHQLYVARHWESRDSHMHATPNFVSLDVGNKSWKSLAPMTHRRGRCCLVPLGDHIYAIGGFGVEYQESMKKCEVYSIKEDVWREITPMPCPVYRVWPNSAVAFEGKILVFGDGFNLMMYDPISNTWHALRKYAFKPNIHNLPLEHKKYLRACHGPLRTDQELYLPCVSGLVVQDGKCYRAVGGGSHAFSVHEVIIDHNNMNCTSGDDQREDQDAIYVSFLPDMPRMFCMLAFCIGQDMYVQCGGGYHKQDVKVPARGWLEGRPNIWRLCERTACVTTLTFDTAVLK
ncbi:kelch-like protein 38 [Amphiura filiformis]|uniref:kelch-like protein 38 n=1 Tax=Amphiura filiformis TaxID=82378 RepID=UPI003B2243E4